MHTRPVKGKNDGYMEILAAFGPYDYPSAGMTRLQALLRVLTGDKDTDSDDLRKRFIHKSPETIISFTIAFLIHLGQEVMNEHFDLDTAVARMTQEGLQEPQKHVFVHAAQCWATTCIKLLEDAVEAAHIVTWRSSLAKLASASDLSVFLQLFYAHPVQWPGIRITYDYERKALGRLQRQLYQPWVPNEEFLFNTTKGYIGITHHTARESDIIVVLRGSSVPVVLRPAGHRYKFVSGCIVQGLMDGQAMDWIEKGTAQEQRFEII